MFSDFENEMFEDRINHKMDIMYKVLDKNDQDYQGLYKRAETEFLDGRGMWVKFRQKVEPGDIMLVEMFFEDECRLIKTCCEIKSVEMIREGLYAAEMEFIIIKESYMAFWNGYLMKKMEMMI